MQVNAFDGPAAFILGVEQTANPMDLRASVEAAAKPAGLVVTSAEPGENIDGSKTTKFTVARADAPAKTQQLELGDGFDAGRSDLASGLGVYFAELTKRLENPRPECHYTMHGLPLSFGRFGWPFHASRSGADTSLVHGEVRLEDGGDALLHAKVAVSMTLTFREVVPAPEQPFAEGFIYNAVRKTMDQGQLELVKSGNRQPVPLTTRYYSTRQKKFIFNDTTAEQRQRVSGGQGILALGRAGRRRAGVAGGSARCAVPGLHSRRAAAGCAGAGGGWNRAALTRGVRRGDREVDSARRRVPRAAGEVARVHAARIQRRHAIRHDQYVGARGVFGPCCTADTRAALHRGFSYCGGCLCVA